MHLPVSIGQFSLHLEPNIFFETGMGLAKDGKVNKKGMPKLLQTVLLLDRFKREFRLGKPSYKFQQVLLKSLSPVAKLAGYKAVYEKYID